MRGNSQLTQVSFDLRVVGSSDPSHALRAAAQLEALCRLLQGGEAR